MKILLIIETGVTSQDPPLSPREALAHLMHAGILSGKDATQGLQPEEVAEAIDGAAEIARLPREEKTAHLLEIIKRARVTITRDAPAAPVPTTHAKGRKTRPALPAPLAG